MTTVAELTEMINHDRSGDIFRQIYKEPELSEYQKPRYKKLLCEFEKNFGGDCFGIFSAPGRTEIGGNHTDHQHGEVLCAAINPDTIAAVSPASDGSVCIISEGYGAVNIPSDALTALNEKDKGTTKALTCGVLNFIKEAGFKIGGFNAYMSSDVTGGSGLSSSAAFETLICTIISQLYNEGSISPVDIAVIGQKAENIYFGKPCGLMDQMACSVGSLCHIDFADNDEPKIEKISLDLADHGYCICITDVRSSHADLTDEYAAIPTEMRSVAEYFGKDFLAEVEEDKIYNNIPALRKACGDRAVLRAIHFVEENRRVIEEADALKKRDIPSFLDAVQRSGDSSFRFLQNIYSPSSPASQSLSVALAISEHVLGSGRDRSGACRVHGGGFAGTIQAFVPKELVSRYRTAMDKVFGDGACSVLYIRTIGGTQVF